MKKLFLGAIAILLVGAFACSDTSTSDSGNTNSQNQLGDTLVVDAGEISEDVMNLLSSIPSPRDAVKLLKDAGATYEQNLLNPENKVNNYRTQSEQALALGIYTADLSYASVFEKNDASLRYLSSIRNLADQLAIGNVFDKNLEIRLKENSNNKDSLDAIFDDTFDQLSEELKKSKQIPVQALLFSGAWIESAYLATQHWKLSPKPSIKNQILERRITLDDLIKLLETYKSNEGAAKLLPEFKSLQKDFITKEGGKDLSDSGAETIYKKIKKLRTHLVK